MAAPSGGARRDRTDDLLLAKQALSQLSYGPAPVSTSWLIEVLAGLPSRSSRAEFASLRPSGYGVTAFASLGERRLVGLGRLELPTSRVSSARSNQLSYNPLTLFLRTRIKGLTRAHRRKRRMHSTSAKPLARVRPRRKRNEDGEIPPMELSNPETAGP